jgi:hypothetical protein
MGGGMEIRTPGDHRKKKLGLLFLLRELKKPVSLIIVNSKKDKTIYIDPSISTLLSLGG